MPTRLDSIVSQVLVEAGNGVGSRGESSFIHLLTPTGARRVEALTNQIGNRNVRRLLERFWLGDREAETVLLLKYLPVILPYVRSMNPKRNGDLTTVVPDSPIPFSLEELKELAIDQEDVIQDAVVILLDLLRSYQAKGSVSLGSYLKGYFRKRFVEKTARTVLYREKGKLTAKAKALRNDDLITVQGVGRSAPITNFAEFLNQSDGASYLLRDLRHYFNDQSPQGTRLYDWIVAVNNQGWRLRMRIWTRRLAPPLPVHDAPPAGTVDFFVTRDELLDEYLRTPHAHRYVDRLKRGSLGDVQIKVFRHAYTEVDCVHDRDLAQELGVTRQRIQEARSSASQKVLQMAMDDYQAYIKKVSDGLQKNILGKV